MLKIVRAGLLLGALFMAGAAVAQDDEANLAAAKAFVAKLDFQRGTATVPAAEATLALGDKYRFLQPADARKVLEQLWGNPPDESVLGLIVPTTPALYEDDAWAVLVTFTDEGYVSDEDAAKIDYSELLQELQEGTRDSNDARKSQGYPTVDLVGWAEPPRYDQATAKLYWAKELKFEGTDQNTLNYEVRVLGRRGVLSLEAIANMSELPQVRTGMQDVLAAATFNDGARYADYDASTDKLAGYGVAALIGGVAASKMGLFAKLGILLLKAKKLLIFIVLGLAWLGRKIFGGKKDAGTAPR